jgi:WD40 repeat protein
MPEGGVLLDRGVPGGVVRAALSPDGKLVATAGAHRLARLYDVRSGKLVYTLRGHSAPLTDVIFSADGRRLATTSADGHPRIWDVRTGKLIFLLVGHFGPVATAAFSADGRWLVTAGPISAGLWPLHTGRLLFYLRGDTKRLTDVSFSPDGRQIASASADGTVRLYDCELCAPLKGLVALAQHRLARTAAALTRDQRERYLPH